MSGWLMTLAHPDRLVFVVRLVLMAHSLPKRCFRPHLKGSVSIQFLTL